MRRRQRKNISTKEPKKNDTANLIIVLFFPPLPPPRVWPLKPQICLDWMISLYWKTFIGLIASSQLKKVVSADSPCLMNLVNLTIGVHRTRVNAEWWHGFHPPPAPGQNSPHKSSQLCQGRTLRQKPPPASTQTNKTTSKANRFQQWRNPNWDLLARSSALRHVLNLIYRS